MPRTTEKTPPYCSSSDSSGCTAHASCAQKPTAQFWQVNSLCPLVFIITRLKVQRSCFHTEYSSAHRGVFGQAFLTHHADLPSICVGPFCRTGFLFREPFFRVRSLPLLYQPQALSFHWEPGVLSSPLGWGHLMSGSSRGSAIVHTDPQY